MNLKEAYSTLELQTGATPEEAKKKYRELTKRYHPDINKEKDAEANFKKINEAYECIKNGKGNERQAFNPFQKSQYHQPIAANIDVHLAIDFKESVLGCKKELKYARQGKCSSCRGSGEIRQNNGCKKCSGKGQIATQQRGMIFMSTCPDCFGQSSTIDCSACSGHRFTHTDVAVHVTIPGGVLNGSTLRLQGMGNYIGSMMGLVDQFSDVFCHITVASEPGLSIDGKHVITTISLTLLEALIGCDRTVKTIFGDRRIKINPQSRNRDEVIIAHHGVAGTGDQKVILDVQYPTNTDQLIDLLTKEVI